MMLRRMMMAEAGGGGDIGASILAKLVAWYDFDGDQVNAINPTGEAGQIGPMSVFSGEGFVPGKHGQAIASARAGVNVGGDFSRMPGILTDGVAMFGWFRPTASGNRVLAALAQNAPAGELIWLDYVSGQIGGQYRDGDGVITPTRQNAPLSQWAFACVTYNRATRECAVCINGSFQRMVKTTNGTQSNATRYLGLGSIYSNTMSGADVDAFGLADHPLTDEEILWLYNGGTGREFSDLAP